MKRKGIHQFAAPALLLALALPAKVFATTLTDPALSLALSTILTGSPIESIKMSLPYPLAIDSVHGAFYVPDYAAQRVDKFDLITGAFLGWLGTIYSTGGTCTAGAGLATGGWCHGGVSTYGAGDGMVGGPVGLAVDSTYVYVVEFQNHRIQRFNSETGAAAGWLGKIATPPVASATCTGKVGEFGGGWCTGGTTSLGVSGGQLYYPYGVVADEVHGFLYVADGGNARIVKYSLATGAFAGWLGGTLLPGGALASTGGWTTGGLSSGGGHGDGMFVLPVSLSIDVVGGYLFVMDYAQARVQRFVLSSGAFAGWIGAIYVSPTGGAPGCAGAPAGTATPGWCLGGSSTIGTGDGMLSYPHDAKVDTAHNALYVADYYNQRVQKFNLNSGSFSGWLGAIGTPGGSCSGAVGTATGGWCWGGTAINGLGTGMLNGPIGAAYDSSSGTILVTEYGGSRIQRFNAVTGASAGIATGVGSPSWSAPLTPAATQNLAGYDSELTPKASALFQQSMQAYYADQAATTRKKADFYAKGVTPERDGFENDGTVYAPTNRGLLTPVTSGVASTVQDPSLVASTQGQLFTELGRVPTASEVQARLKAFDDRIAVVNQQFLARRGELAALRKAGRFDEMRAIEKSIRDATAPAVATGPGDGSENAVTPEIRNELARRYLITILNRAAAQ